MRPSGIKAFKVNSGERLELLHPSTLQQEGFKERQHLQAWLEANPEIVADDMLLITTEFDRWEWGRGIPVRDRLDMMYLDGDANLVICELKRGEANDSTDLQALKYASYCSTLTVKDIIEEYGRYHNATAEEASAALAAHTESRIEESGIEGVRVFLIAESFGLALTHTVLWLRDHEIDIRCIEVNVFGGDGKPIVTTNQVVPPPQAEDFMVRKRAREKEEEEIERRRPRARSVQIIIDHGAVKPGEKLTLNLDAFTAELRPKVERLVAEQPSVAEAEWTGDTMHSLNWKYDDGSYSCNMATNKIRELIGYPAISLTGPSFWQLSNGETLTSLAERLVREESKIGEGEEKK